MASGYRTVRETAAYLNLAENTIWTWIYSRRLGHVRLGRSVRIPQEAIDELIESGTRPAMTA